MLLGGVKQACNLNNLLALTGKIEVFIQYMDALQCWFF